MSSLEEFCPAISEGADRQTERQTEIQTDRPQLCTQRYMLTFGFSSCARGVDSESEIVEVHFDRG